MPTLPETEYRALVRDIAAALEVQATAMAAPATTRPGLAAALEPTLLSPTATGDEVDRLCAFAAHHRVAAVCVAPTWLARAAAGLRATPVAVSTVVGFPLGANLGTTKLHEASECVRLGADELDVVVNLGAVRAGDGAVVAGELRSICAVAHAAGARVKAILELPVLDEAEVRRAAAWALEAGVDFLKTATGYGPDARPATPGDVALLRGLAPAGVGIKAAGGIRSAAAAMALLAAGADRIGTSAAAAILE